MNPRRLLLSLFATLFAGLTLFFGWAFWANYWVWRGQFGTEGRAYDPETGAVFLEQAGIIWGGFFLLSASLTALLAWRAFRGRRDVPASLGLGA